MIIKKIKSLYKNKEAKVLLENIFSLSALQVIGYVVPFLTLPYLARIIGVEKFGVLAFATAIIVFLQTVTDYGFNYTAVRDIAQNRNNIEKISSIFCTVLYARLILTVLSFFLLVVMIMLIPTLQDYKSVLLLSFLAVPGYVVFPEWFFQAMEKMKYVTIMNILSKIIFTASIFLVVKQEEDYLLVPVLTALGFLVSGCIGMIYIIKFFNIHWKVPRLSEVISIVKGSTNMFISLALPNLYTNMSVIMLESLGGKFATGIFDGGNKFVGISQRLADVLSRAFYPLLARKIEKHTLYRVVSFTFSFLISVILFFGAEFIISFFYTEEFLEAATVLKIMSISPIFLFMMNVYGTNYLVLINKENILRNIVLGCSILGIILSYFLISKYSFIGAAYSIVSIWGIRGFSTWCFARKYRKRLKVSLTQVQV